jgi:hypothetical protein
MTRYIINVIEKIINVIPSDQEILITELNNFKEMLVFMAPEVLHFSNQPWIGLRDILSNNIPKLDEDWKEKVSNIFADKN